jgi:hypothetical protein
VQIWEGMDRSKTVFSSNFFERRGRGGMRKLSRHEIAWCSMNAFDGRPSLPWRGWGF